MRLGTRNIAFAAAVVIGTFTLSNPAPACGCIETSPAAKNWTSCALIVARKNGQSKFYDNYIDARLNNQKLLSSTPARFAILEKKIIKSCGTYEKARKKDLAAGWEAENVPDNFLEARWH